MPDAAALAAEHQQELEAVAVVDREPRHEQLVVLDHRPQLLGLGQPLLDRGHDVVGVGPRHLQTGDLAIGELEGQRGLEVLGLDVDARIVDPDQHDAGVRDLLLLVADRDVDLVLVRLRVNADRCVHLHAVDQPPAAQQEPVEQPGHDRAQQRDPGDDGVEADGGQVDGHGGRACHVSKPTDRRGHDTPGDDAAFQELPCRPREFLTEVLFGY
ncbi:MAG TPA: hypothetical protein VEK80_06950 [Kribbellaceae bacterium]|nr:hypothetical protein [Kribbellaceae bacterium]